MHNFRVGSPFLLVPNKMPNGIVQKPRNNMIELHTQTDGRNKFNFDINVDFVKSYQMLAPSIKYTYIV